MNSYDFIPELVEAGLDGIELNHLDHTEEDKQKIMEYAAKYNLVLSGGSDFHGRFGAEIGIGDIECPASFIEFLQKEKSFFESFVNLVNGLLACPNLCKVRLKKW